MSATVVPMNIKSKSNLQLCDFAEEMSGFAVTADFKGDSNSTQATVHVSGTCVDGRPRLLLRLETVLQPSNEADSIRQLRTILEGILLAVTNLSFPKGLDLSNQKGNGSQVVHIARQHLEMLSTRVSMSQRPLNLSMKTAFQFSLAKSFGIANVVETIALVEGVPVTTVRRRLAKARNAGLIEKIRGQINAQNH